MSETKGSLITNPVSAADQTNKDLIAKYKKLKELLMQLGGKQGNIKKAKDAYQAKRKETATLCREIYLAEKSQGNRTGGGFEANLKTIVGMKKNTAYRLMAKFFEDTPKIDSKRQLRSERAKSANVLELQVPVHGTTGEEFKKFIDILGWDAATSVMYEALKLASEEKVSKKKTFIDEPEMPGDGETFLGHMQQNVMAETAVGA